MDHYYAALGNFKPALCTGGGQPSIVLPRSQLGSSLAYSWSTRVTMSDRSFMISPASPRLAVTSYLPFAPRWDPHWPTSGPTDRKATLDLLPDPSLITIQDLPATHCQRLHFQKGAYWVVLAIDLADYDGSGHLHGRRSATCAGAARQAKLRDEPIPASIKPQAGICIAGTLVVCDKNGSRVLPRSARLRQRYTSCRRRKR